jgi:hypothetical protein
MKPLASAFIVALLSTLVSSAQAQSKNIHEQTDPYTGLRSLFLEVGTHTCPGDQSPGLHDPEVHLLLSATQNPDRSVSYFLTPELDHAGYSLNLRKNGTMDTLLGDAAGSYTTLAGSTTTTQYSGDHSYLHETIPFNVSQDDLTKLSSAEWFQFRINGSRQDVQRCTDAKHLRDVAEFVHAAASFGPPAALAPVTESDNSLKSFSVDAIPTFACSGDAALSSRDPGVQLTIVAEQHADHTVKYFIVTDLGELKPLNLPNKSTLEVKIDGLAQAFHNPHPSTVETLVDPDGHSFVHETVAFHVDRRDILALAKSSTFEFRIDGARAIRRCTDAANLKQLAGFISDTATLYDHPVAVASAPPQH